MKWQVFAAKYHTPDSLDADTVRHFDWYEATGFKVPFPGEKTVRPASDFNHPARSKTDVIFVPTTTALSAVSGERAFLFTP
jgi:hypothetical protein